MDSDYEFVLKRYPTERYGKILEVFDLTFHCQVTDKKLRVEFSLILDRLTSLYKERNTFIHSWWLFSEDDSFVLRFKNLKFPKVDHDPQPSVSKLNQLADNLDSSA